ncbi:ProQ/FINO family protein [Cysteiniphilum halobium]|uniref:ProQ/FINO family protein n=1 Tax=Cysteiniphilum halobium TaxID=2219059 RepID=UPI000E64E9E5|nr:ProQ/FINO family protein [Cysteiniphilum halobium]
MSDGRNKLNDFSLLKSLVGGKSIKDKTDRLRKAHAAKRNETSDTKTTSSTHRPNTATKQAHQTRQERVNQPRTPFRMPQYGQKQHEELIVDMPDVQEDELIIEIDLQKELYKEEQRLFKWLCTRFPKCFNPRDKRPLKIGISDDIEVIYYNEHFAPIDPYVLKKVIKRYVGDTRYQRSVLDHKQRFNLYGKPVETFSDDHIAYAKQRLDEIAEKAYLRSQGIDIKTYYQQKREQEQQEQQEKQALEQTENNSQTTDADAQTNDAKTNS